MHRRTFIKGIAGILAAGMAPAVLPSGIIMPVRQLWIPDDSWWESLPLNCWVTLEGVPVPYNEQLVRPELP